MLSIRDNKEHIIWPNKWDWGHWDAPESAFGKSYWYYSRIIKARATDKERKCIECGKADFEIGDTVVREQLSKQSWDTLHPMCSLNKLIRVQDEMINGVNELRLFIQRDESISENQ